METTSSAKTLITQPNLCVDTSNINTMHTDNVTKLMKLQLVSFPSAIYRPSSRCRDMLTQIQIAGVLLKQYHLNTGAKSKPIIMAK